jgi:hypothetical protein
LTLDQDLQLCVPPSSSATAAAGLLFSTGLFEPFEPPQDTKNDIYSGYKHGFPHLRTTGWTSPALVLIIFPAAFFGLVPIEEVLVRPRINGKVHVSKEMEDLKAADLMGPQVPRLAVLMHGLGKRYLETRDDVSMIALEQLVDGMNADESWVQDNLEASESAVAALVTHLVRNKKGRLDPFSGNTVTCFVRDEAEAEAVKLIPGFE